MVKSFLFIIIFLKLQPLYLYGYSNRINNHEKNRIKKKFFLECGLKI